MATASAPETGYRLDGIQFPLQHCEMVDPGTLGDAGEPEEPIRIGWDWGWVEMDKTFEVAVTLERDANLKRPELVRVQVVGRFHISGAPPSVQTEEFALANATAILVPYARQVFTQLTANGPFGAQILQPINVAAAVKKFDRALATAAKQRAAAK